MDAGVGTVMGKRQSAIDQARTVVIEKLVAYRDDPAGERLVRSIGWRPTVLKAVLVLLPMRLMV